MKIVAVLLLILFLIPQIQGAIVSSTVTSTTKTTEPLVPLVQTVQKVHTVTPGQFTQDLGSNTLQTTPKAFSFYRPGGNFSIGAVALTVNGESIALSNPNGGLFPQGLSNSTVTEYLYDQSVVILPNTYHAHLELYLKDIQGSYNREIILKGSGDVNGVPMNSNAPLQMQFPIPQAFNPSICDSLPHQFVNLQGQTMTAQPCTTQFFGNMGMNWSNSPYPTSYNNSTQTLTYSVPSSFLIDPVALDGSAKTSCSACSSLAVNLTTANTNDIIIVVVNSFISCPNTSTGITDAVGLTWTNRNQKQQGGATCLSYYYAVSTGILSADSIQVTIAVNHFISMVVFGVSGATLGNCGSGGTTCFDSNGGLPASNQATSAGTNKAVTFSTSNPNDFLMVFNGDDNLVGCACSYSADSGYAIIQALSSATSVGLGTEYQVVSSTQSGVTETLQITPTECISCDWISFADAIQQAVTTVTQPIKITVDNSGASATFTITNCHPSPTTIVTDAATHNIVIDASCGFIITVSADGATIRYRWSGGATILSETSCATGTCSLISVTVFEELLNTYQATPVGPTVWDAAYSIPVKGTVAGAVSTTGCSISTTLGGGAANCQAWFDFNRIVTVTASFGSWMPFPIGSNTFTQTTGGNTDNVNYTIPSSGGGDPPNLLWMLAIPFILILLVAVRRRR